MPQQANTSTESNVDLAPICIGGAVVVAMSIAWRRWRKNQQEDLPDWVNFKPNFLGEFEADWKHGPDPSKEALIHVKTRSPHPFKMSWESVDEPPLPEKNSLGLDAISQKFLEHKPFMCGLNWGPKQSVRERGAYVWFAEYTWRIPSCFKEEFVRGDGFEGYWYNWPGVEVTDPDSVILYCHGGAGVFGSVEGTRPHAVMISQAYQKRLFSCRVGLGPEDPYPAGTKNVVACYRWMVEKQKIPPNKICITGYSSGGAICMLATQEILQTPDLPNPACVVPVTPWSWQEQDRNPLNVHLWQMTIGNRDENGKVTGNHDVRDPKFSYLNGPFKGLPPLYVLCESCGMKWSIMISLETVRKARAAGVDCVLDLDTYSVHCPACFMHIPEAMYAAARTSAWIDEKIKEASASK